MPSLRRESHTPLRLPHPYFQLPLLSSRASPGVIPSEVEGSWLDSNMGKLAGNILLVPVRYRLRNYHINVYAITLISYSSIRMIPK